MQETFDDFPAELLYRPLHPRNDFYEVPEPIEKEPSTPTKSKTDKTSQSTSGSSHTRSRRSNPFPHVEHKKSAKEPLITIANGQSLAPLVGPVSTAEVRIKALRIADAFENAKEIQTLFRAFHEIWRTFRQRAVDIALLQSIVDGTSLLPKEQTMEDVCNKIAASELTRVKIEHKKIELLAVFYVEEKETKKYKVLFSVDT